MIKVAITGANGQLGKCLRTVLGEIAELDGTFVSKTALDITNNDKVDEFFGNNTFDYCINTAAYTNVEKAETDKDTAFSINAEGAKNVAKACSKNGVTLIQISTDYVFDGEKREPYDEEDKTNPLNVYGASKLKGEQNVIVHCPAHFIVRTSWLYSQYGHNFYKTIRKNVDLGKDLTITTEQTGTPTNANDLAAFLVTIIQSNNNNYGVYHYTNSGSGTWYDFAAQIVKATGQNETINLAKTDYYPTFAARPVYSVLSTQKAEKVFGITPIFWQKSLQQLTKKNF